MKKLKCSEEGKQQANRTGGRKLTLKYSKSSSCMMTEKTDHKSHKKQGRKLSIGVIDWYRRRDVRFV